MLLLLLPACAWFEEQRTDPTEVIWSGWVLADLPGEDVPALEAGTFEVVDLDGEPLADGVEDENNPGYWQVEVPVGTEVGIRVAGGEQVPTVWRARTPTGRGYWLSGGLFAVRDDTQAELFDSLEGWQGLSPDALADGEVAHLWGTPWLPEDWAGALIEVEHTGGVAQVASFAVAEDGSLLDAGTGVVDLFVAPDLSPGPVTLRVTAVDGRVAETTWIARGGDLLSAFYFALPSP